ncbi:glycosyltransferase family A protein [Microbacterium sp. 1P10UB]|uniref:glycosyltransferase family 2 protein n=1 Tax=unclassified Microbacterium TaxID=2609290 RepID=UPI0039A2D937
MTPTRTAVIVPVHDEEELLGDCLSSIIVATKAVRVPVEIVVALDACSDGSAGVAASAGVRTVELAARLVGAARRAGTTRALELLDGEPRDLWLAHTDADSIVPPHWLAHQLALRDAGADLVLGTVRPDFRGLSARHAAHWTATHPRGRPAANVHGANLGLRADAYLAAGGFPAVAEHEDVELVARARAAGAAVVVSDDGEVLTSARFTGRTPGGYAAFLRALAADLDGGVPIDDPHVVRSVDSSPPTRNLVL